LLTSVSDVLVSNSEVLTPVSEELVLSSEVLTLPSEVLTPVSEEPRMLTDVLVLISDALTLLSDVLVLDSEELTLAKLESTTDESASPTLGAEIVVSAYCACADSAVARSATATVPSPALVVNAVPIKPTAKRPIAFDFRITTGI